MIFEYTDSTNTERTNLKTDVKTWRPIRDVLNINTDGDQLVRLQKKVIPPVPAGSTAVVSGVPGNLSAIFAVQSPAKTQGRTVSEVSVTFNVIPAATYSNTRIWITGYKGNTNPVLVTAAAQGPVNFLLETTGEVITVTGQPVAQDGSVIPLSSCLSTIVVLNGVVNAPPSPTISQTLVTIPLGYQFSYNQLVLSAGTQDVIDSYRIYRNTSNTFSGATLLRVNRHDPTASSAVVVQDIMGGGQTFYYFVTAVNTAALESAAVSAQSGAVVSGTANLDTDTVDGSQRFAGVQAAATADGFQILSNPDFLGGSLTGYSVYDNNSTGNVTITAVSDVTAPNSSGWRMDVKTVAGSAPSPGLGGFFRAIGVDAGPFAPNTYHKGSTIVWRLRVNLPVGYKLQFATNATGTGGTFTWLTSQAGTGGYFDYVGKQIIGTSGSFSSTGFFYVDTGTAPVTWSVATCSAVCVTHPSGFGVSDVDVNRRANIDFTQGTHISKNLDNIGDTATFKRVNTNPANGLNTGTAVDSSGNILLKNIANGTGSTSFPTTTSSSFVTIPEMTQTITTKGNKVLVVFTGSFITNTISSGVTTGFVALFRDGTQISGFVEQGRQTADDTESYTLAVSFIDNPSAGSHTYDARWQINSGGTGTLQAVGTNRQIQVVELG